MQTFAKSRLGTYTFLTQFINLLKSQSTFPSPTTVLASTSSLNTDSKPVSVLPVLGRTHLWHASHHNRCHSPDIFEGIELTPVKQAGEQTLIPCLLDSIDWDKRCSAIQVQSLIMQPWHFESDLEALVGIWGLKEFLVALIFQQDTIQASKNVACALRAYMQLICSHLKHIKFGMMTGKPQ